MIEGADRAAQDQFEAAFDEIEFHVGATEVRLTKSDGANWPTVKMAAFLRCLSRWSQRMALDGYEIRAEALAGPGTMVWTAVKK